ncbi:MAG: DNA repair protein RecN [Flavobacteriales bacterium]|nr:DNA repair protein RecN [Bacteroidota bacterium]MCB9241113.1 DNA repair protein RecN [Flavobacteriales bacterium]
MLKSLRIDNYVLIKSLHIEPGSGLNILTGETGAGKSIIIGALGLILGERADLKAVAQADRKSIVEGVFDVSQLRLLEFFRANDLDYLDETIIRREVLPEGRSRAFVNDTPVSLNVLKDLGERLIDIHSQHQTIRVSDSAFLFHWLDSVSGTTELLTNYQEQYTLLRKLERSLSELQEADRQEAAQADYNNFLWNELDQANLKQQELEDLESEAGLLQNAEEIGMIISAVVQEAAEMDQSMVDRLQAFSRQLSRLAGDQSGLSDLTARLQSVTVELEDVVRELGQFGQSLSVDNNRLDQANERIHFLQQLLQKHRVNDVSELIEVRNRLDDVLVSNDDRKREMDDLSRQIQDVSERSWHLAKQLLEKRVGRLKDITDNMEHQLALLGMPSTQIRIELQQNEQLSRHGSTSIRLLISTNKGRAPQPVQTAASGGELSRLMLVMKSELARHRALPSIVFDEIDTGVSGEVSLRMADLMRDLSNHLQVFAITHLPQIAAKGQTHFFVYKSETEGESVTGIRQLLEEDRVQEIAKMLSGDTPTTAAIENAKELLHS